MRCRATFASGELCFQTTGGAIESLYVDICASTTRSAQGIDGRPDAPTRLLVAFDFRTARIVGQEAFEGALTTHTLVVLFESVAARYGMPSSVRFDNGLEFVKAAAPDAMNSLGFQ